MATGTLPRATTTINPGAPAAAAFPLSAAPRSGRSPRPSAESPGIVSHQIGAATLVSGARVINCWDIWSGGFEIVLRFDPTDSHQVAHVASWATRQGRPCTWKTSGFPVRDADEVFRTFDRTDTPSIITTPGETVEHRDR